MKRLTVLVVVATAAPVVFLYLTLVAVSPVLWMLQQWVH